MRTFRGAVLIPVAALLLIGCSDEQKTQPTTLAIGGVTTLAPGDTSGSSVAGGGSTGGVTDGSVTDGPLQIDVVVGTDSSPNRIERVKAGNDVTLNITNPNAADSYHVHGYDLEQTVGKAVTATINFTADTKGTFEVESHITNAVLLVIEVS